MANLNKMSDAQFAALTRISEPIDSEVKSPYKYFLKERTARALINRGLAYQVGERIDRITNATQPECVVTPLGRAMLHSETIRREYERQR